MRIKYFQCIFFRDGVAWALHTSSNIIFRLTNVVLTNIRKAKRYMPMCDKKNSVKWSHLIGLAAIVLLLLPAASTNAQQAPDAPCSPSATTTVDGKYVPPPPSEFAGTINLSATDSKSCWPPTVVPP